MRKLIACFAALAVASVVMFAGTPADAGWQPSGNPYGPAFIGYAPVWSGSNSDYSSEVIAKVQLSDSSNLSAYARPSAFIYGYDDNSTSNAETVCAQLVTYNVHFSGLYNEPEVCNTDVGSPGENAVSRAIESHRYEFGWRAFGATYKTWPDGHPLNGRQWSNSILG